VVLRVAEVVVVVWGEALEQVSQQCNLKNKREEKLRVFAKFAKLGA